MEELVEPTGIATSWIQTNVVDNGTVVLSFYGIRSSNSDSAKIKANEGYLTALWRYLAHHRKKTIFICMDANVHRENK